MMYRRIETALAWFSVAAAVVHFLLETLYHVQVGQPLPFLIVDYLADALLLLGAWHSLRSRPRPAAGVLCGAWGFTCCLAYMAFFSFWERVSPEGSDRTVVLILGVALAFAAGAFLLSLLLARDGSRQPSGGVRP